jgi:hypothetical protein
MEYHDACGTTAGSRICRFSGKAVAFRDVASSSSYSSISDERYIQLCVHKAVYLGTHTGWGGDLRLSFNAKNPL